MPMKHLDQLLNFFGNPGLDRHRLLQGKWHAYHIDCDDPDSWSDNPLELLLSMLTEELHRGDRSEELSRRFDSPQSAVLALDALLSTALSCLSESEFNNMTRRFWAGFQFVAHGAALELGVVFSALSRDDVRGMIERRYGHHPA